MTKYYDEVFKRHRYTQSNDIESLIQWFYSYPEVTPLESKIYRKESVLGPKTANIITMLKKIGGEIHLVFNGKEINEVKNMRRYELLLKMGYIKAEPSNYSGVMSIQRLCFKLTDLGWALSF